MVGVPGKSKGCNTCIQRKIKCDQGTPQCGNCRKSNRLCTGYKRKLVYVLSSDMISDGPGRELHGDTTIHHYGRWRRSSVQKSSFVTPPATEPIPIPIDGSNGSISRHLCQQIFSIPAMRQQFHHLFSWNHLPQEMRGSDYQKPTINSNYLHQLQDSSIDSPALENSLAALFAARLGYAKRDPYLVHWSRSIYVAGLDQLQNALSNQQTRLQDETLAACMTLSLYELSESTEGMKNAYMAHRKGAMMLLEMRGPQACSTPLGHSLFLALRAQTITPCLEYHLKTFLSHSEWAELPWKNFPKRPYDQIMDLLYRLPAMLSQYDELSKEQDKHRVQETICNLIAEYQEINMSLHNLYTAYESSISGPLYWSELSTLESSVDNIASGKVFPVSFYFQSFAVAQLMTTYWTAMMVLHLHLMHGYTNLAKVASLISQMGTGDSSLPCQTPAAETLPLSASSLLKAEEHLEKWSNMVRNICQSMQYFMQDQMGGLGSINSLSLIYGCRGCMGSAPERWIREIQWATEMIDKIEVKLDFPIRKVLLGQ